MDSSWFSTLARTLARFARAYPLRQIALAATLFLPTTVLLHLLFASFGAEGTLDDMIGPWALTVTGAGLAYLIALAWTGLLDTLAAKRRRSYRASRQSQVAEQDKLTREAWRETIRSLTATDKNMLLNFVDDRCRRIESRNLADRDDLVLPRLESLGILDDWWPYAVMAPRVFDLLLSEPALIDSTSQPIKRIA